MSYEKSMKQVKNKPAKLSRFIKFCTTKKRKFGKNKNPCRRCNKKSGVIRKYGLLYCRQCFREHAERLGFNKYN